MTSQSGLQTIGIHTLFNSSQSKGNQTVKFGQLIEHNKRKISLEKFFCKHCAESDAMRLFPDLFLFFLKKE